MRTGMFLGLLLFASSAIAQTLSTSVGTVLTGVGVLCQNNGTGRAACSGHWRGAGGEESVAGGGTANAQYGTLSADAKAIINCSVGCVLSDQTVSGSNFTDTANVENAPTSGSSFLITISLNGSVSNVNTASPVLQLDINGNSAQCAITSDQGTCHASLPVVGPTASFDFSVGLVSSVVASLNGSGPGIDNEYANMRGRISELAVVGSNGRVLKNVLITTASGHAYPK